MNARQTLIARLRFMAYCRPQLLAGLLRVALAMGVLGALLLSMSAQAGTVGLHLATVHHGNDQLRTATPGLYWRGDSGVTLGAYRNSYARDSVYGGFTLSHRAAAFDADLSLTLGAVTGYPARRVLPLAVPSARIGWLRVAFIPNVLKSQTAVGLHLAIERPLP